MYACKNSPSSFWWGSLIFGSFSFVLSFNDGTNLRVLNDVAGLFLPTAVFVLSTCVN